MSKTFKTVWNLLSSAVILAVLILAMLLSGVRIFGLQVFAVLSGSMEPLYKTGSLIYVRKLEDAKAVPDGTVITFMASEDTIVTHRVVGSVPDEDEPGVVRYRTKGDANEMEDGLLVHYKNIVGTPVFTIPNLGYVANFIQKPPGLYLTISFGAVFVLLLFLPELFAAIFGQETDEAGSRSKSGRKKRNNIPRSGRRGKAEDDVWADGDYYTDKVYYPQYRREAEDEYLPRLHYPEDDFNGRYYYPEERRTQQSYYPEDYPGDAYAQQAYYPEDYPEDAYAQQAYYPEDYPGDAYAQQAYYPEDYPGDAYAQQAYYPEDYPEDAYAQQPYYPETYYATEEYRFARENNRFYPGEVSKSASRKRRGGTRRAK